MGVRLHTGILLLIRTGELPWFYSLPDKRVLDRPAPGLVDRRRWTGLRPRAGGDRDGQPHFRGEPFESRTTSAIHCIPG